MALMLALYQRGDESGRKVNPLTNTDAACEVWEEMLAQTNDKSSWSQPTTSVDASCGHHPDFPAWIGSQRKPRRVSKDEIIVVDPIKVTGG
jgi:hypothetical protein